MTEESPFQPGRPVKASGFSGREDLVNKLLDTAESACRGRFQVAYISGERGIGKSSLAQMVRHIAERKLEMVTAYVALGGVDNLTGLARRTLLSLVQDNDNTPWFENVTKELGQRIKKVGAFGVNFELNMPETDLQGIVDNFANQMNGLLEKIGDDRKGLMLVLDDINGLAEKPAFANWLKSMVDSVAVGGRKIPPVFLLFTGLEERRQKMIEHNPSVARVFQPTLFVKPWMREETLDFFEQRFKEGGVKLSETELGRCATFSGGLPMLAQEIGHAVWIRSIKGSKPLAGIDDAAEAIGRQYLEAKVMRELHSKHYRAILLKIGHDLSISDTFSKTQLREKIDLSEGEVKVLDDFIIRMCKLGAILPDEESGKRGVYRFPSLLHRLYFLIAADKVMTKQRKKVNERSRNSRKN